MCGHPRPASSTHPGSELMWVAVESWLWVVVAVLSRALWTAQASSLISSKHVVSWAPQRDSATLPVPVTTPLPTGTEFLCSASGHSWNGQDFGLPDDVMMPERVRLQHEAAVQHPTSIIGCRVRRDPPGSTERYTRWINQLAPEQLLTQGKALVCKTLVFATTTIWTHRVCFLEEWALPQWASFTIWNAGKQGRRLYRSLTAASRCKVVAFCDVDENKIRKGFYRYEEAQERPKPRVPVLHFRAARPPFVLCVKLDLTGGEFEENLRSLQLQEGRDFVHFS
ncbi:hypothetical protein GHT09_013603 [Marmota monax]|uniref:UDP-GlcNAc:betaGal beta-1,3-N-acetylglucosaminyltransferase-like protein 1 n=1 Tax=Marmota monax TaxID=9995 RepID=A0A834UIW6_MARMO|nr:hypothetical protein GHT09_013603 [Marmota monax]